MSRPLLIVGITARAAGVSALRAGYRPLTIDAFADTDAASLFNARRVPLVTGLEPLFQAAIAAPAGPWIYVAPFENHPEALDRITARRGPHSGTPSTALRTLRDPFALAALFHDHGCPCPELRTIPDGLPTDGSWLTKPIASGGGLGVQHFDPDRTPERPPVYYQRKLAGRPLSAAFRSAGPGHVELVGLTEQLLGAPGSPFAYLGSLGPLKRPDQTTTAILRLGAAVASAGAIGPFGVDLILSDGIPWPVEVNPRYTASMEVLERSASRSVLTPEPWPSDLPTHRVHGKAVVYAETTCILKDSPPAPKSLLEHFALGAADIPSPGTVHRRGDPVLTVFSQASSLDACRTQLAAAVAHWRARLEPFPQTEIPPTA